MNDPSVINAPIAEKNSPIFYKGLKNDYKSCTMIRLKVGFQFSSASDITCPAVKATTQGVGMTDIHLQICMYVCVCVCLYVCMYVCIMYVCIMYVCPV